MNHLPTKHGTSIATKVDTEWQRIYRVGVHFHVEDMDRLSIRARGSTGAIFKTVTSRHVSQCHPQTTLSHFNSQLSTPS
jgi:hypothetical protein